MATANEILQDGTIRHQVFVTRMQTSVSRRMLGLLNRSEADLVERIARLDPASVADRFKRGRLERLLGDVRDLNAQISAQVKADLRGELGEVAERELRFQQGLIGAATSDLPGGALGFDFVSPARVRAAALSRPFQSVHLRWATQGQHVDEAFRRRLRLVQDEIRRGFVEGDNLGQMIRRVRGTRRLNFRDGILEVSRRSAETMVRTAVNHTANAARQVVYEQNEDLIKAVRWLAILDGRTSAICRGRDGLQFPIDSGPRPPAHPNCRSTTVPILKSFREIGIDADDAPGISGVLDGKAAPFQTYNEWLRGQPKSFVEDVLGRTKAKLYLDGDLTLDKFVDIKGGREFSLEDLAVREAEAFRKAGVPLDRPTRPAPAARPDFEARKWNASHDDPSVSAEQLLGSTMTLEQQREMLQIRQAISASESTHLTHKVDGVWTDSRRALHEEIISEFISEDAIKAATPAAGERPTVAFFGGRGGSGKGWFTRSKAKGGAGTSIVNKNKFIVMDADEIKKRLFKADGVDGRLAGLYHEESAEIFDTIIEAARAKKLNVVLDATLKTTSSAVRKAELFQAAGYDIDGYYMYLPRQEAGKRAIQRTFGEQRRYVPVEIVLKNTTNEESFDAMRPFFRRWRFYDNQVPKGEQPQLIAGNF